MRFITLNENNVIVGIRYGKFIIEGEIQSDSGDLGQIMQEDGTFITPESEPIVRRPTIEEQILIEDQYQTALIEMNMMGVM